MKIGLFGGSFDPIHNSHLKIIKEVLENNLVDEIWIIPCGNHIFGKGLTDSKSRLDMIKLAIGKNNRIKINEVETNSNKPSYAFDTVDELMREFQNYEFYFISGTDIVKDFRKWHRFKELAERIEFILYQRENSPINKNPVIRIKVILSSRLDDISSSEIRERIKNNLDVSELLPKKILGYIKKRGLYR